jgi:lipoprotein-anchoring transpeptidase ErfK/SrfK
LPDAPSPRPRRGPKATPGHEPDAARATAPLTPRAERRHEQSLRKRRRLIAIGMAALLVIGGGAAFAAMSGGGETPARAVAPPKKTTTTTTVPAFVPFTTAATKGADITVYETPAEGAKVVTTLSAQTEYLQPRTLLVTDTQPGWLHALLPMRPNGATGWVRDADVTLGSTPFEIKISLSQHHLWLTNAGAPVLDAPVAIGKSETPTPPGRFYVTDPVDLTAEPNGAYGAFALGISGYSEVLKSFRGGPGQLAIHGGAWDSMLGTDVSNGCVRMLNDTILAIAQQVPLGTPVVIEA